MKTVLIADDSRTTQMLVKTTLQRIPALKFLTADNGRQALAVLDQEAVDLLVTDINMPEMDGIELVREARRRRSRDQLPIVIITAKGEEQARTEGMALGANEYILKPISSRDLLDAASKLLTAPPAPPTSSAAG
jgi:two-component system chemotaxis response regulator CheY